MLLYYIMAENNSADNFYRTLVSYFQENIKNTDNDRIVKEEIIFAMYGFCVNADWDTIFTLKKRMETEFSLDVNCKYVYVATPKYYGCDLREILFDRDEQPIAGANELLELFANKWRETGNSQIDHILTDIDDTLYPHKKLNIPGKDDSWVQKKPYPGIKEFYRQFYSKLEEQYQYTTILSATPGFLKTSKLKDKHGELSPILKDYGFLHGENKKKNYTENIRQLYQMFGNTKFERFKQYKRLFPEYRMIFIGDNGQGDLIAGEKMVEFDNQCLVYIHQISEDRMAYKKVNVSNKLNVQQRERINFFNTYHELGILMKHENIFDRNDHKAITKAFQNEVENGPPEFKHLNEVTRLEPRISTTKPKLTIKAPLPQNKNTRQSISPTGVSEFDNDQFQSAGKRKKTKKNKKGSNKDTKKGTKKGNKIKKNSTKRAVGKKKRTLRSR
jgi:hypothetical protein